MTYSIGPNLPATFRELLPTRFTFEEFLEIAGHNCRRRKAVAADWIRELESPDPFESWRNPEGLYNPNHGRNLLTGWDDKTDKISRIKDGYEV